MDYTLKPAQDADKEWLDSLRRAAYQDLFDTTWGGWDEDRHRRHFASTWSKGHISIILIGDTPVGMVQLLELDEEIEIAEIQILPTHQNQGLGSKVLNDIITFSRDQNKSLLLHLGLKNQDALRLYKRLGFLELRKSVTHIFMKFVE